LSSTKLPESAPRADDPFATAPPPEPRSPWRRRLGRLALALLCVALAVVGAALALRVPSPSVERVVLGTVSTEVGSAWRGGLDAYVPVVDWGVRVHPFWSPVSIRLEFRSLDREAALAALRSGFAAKANLRALEHGLGDTVRSQLRRAALVALLGAGLGGLVGGAIASAILYRRRWLAYGTAAGLAVALVGIPLAGLGVARGNWSRALDAPTFYARGDELPRLLDFSEQLLTTSKRYSDSYDQAIASLSNLIALAGGGTFPVQAATQYMVASDLHLNRFALDALERYAAGSVVFQVGDFGLLGRGVEESIAPQVAHLGSSTIAVSGNHDTRAFMVDLVRNGATVLTRTGQLRVDGSTDGHPVVHVGKLLVAGYDDPLESDSSIEHHELELAPEQRAVEEEWFVHWFRTLPQRPDVVLVHQHALAHALFAALHGQHGAPLVILTGHDHHQHVHRDGRTIIVDGGSAGAGGPLAFGVQPAGFAELHVDSSGALKAIDLVQVEPLSGAASARRLVVMPDGAVAQQPQTAEG
jgi:hypothetical protein